MHTPGQRSTPNKETSTHKSERIDPNNLEPMDIVGKKAAIVVSHSHSRSPPRGPYSSVLWVGCHR